MATDNTDHPVSPAADDVPSTPAPPITKNSKLKTNNSLARYRRGTVARLPKILRDRINHMLEDGLSYTQIARELGADANGLRADHIRRWKSGGYQDYLREQRLIQPRPSAFGLRL
jgi:hypothetical protein